MYYNSVTRKDYTPLIIFTNLANIFANMTIIVRSMYNFVNCLQLFNIRYEKVERPAPVGSALVISEANAILLALKLSASSDKSSTFITLCMNFLSYLLAI